MTVAEQVAEVPAVEVAAQKVEEEEVDVIVPGPEVDTSKLHEKKLKALIKEGGKKGIEIEGAADMGGLQFFCTSVDLPAGNLDYTVASMSAMNAKSDPTEEERKGGAGKIGKMLLSMDDENLAVLMYVPSDKTAELSAKDWCESVCSLSGAKMPEIKTWEGVDEKSWAGAVLKRDSDKGVFTIKMRDPCITNAYTFLKKKGLFPDGDDDSDDDFVFGDDDFPSM